MALRIAFTVRPKRLNDVLPKVLQGVWRTSDEAKAADAKWIEQKPTHSPRTGGDRTNLR
ncbi:hypothetical protein [Bradyrhizobium sp. CB3481]|uniref:hypothetical protein n=1 Tax=Bradyrhizobium sp. CB3481 TaxID=3039158 RepID=UPI0024B1BBD1|nr:hypothetical protein [Bradyrhizobium sp. CB3481]WFU14625.1 hypothetical protein QA643_26465 [Bradyrhizobium sp. CB3481]